MERLTFTTALLAFVTLAGTADAQTVWGPRRRRVEDPCTVVAPPTCCQGRAGCDSDHARRGPALVVVGGERGPCADLRCSGTCGSVHVATPWDARCGRDVPVGPVVTVQEGPRWDRAPAPCDVAPSPWSPRRVARGPRVTVTTCQPAPEACEPEPATRRTTGWTTGRAESCEPAPTGRTARARHHDADAELADAVLDALAAGELGWAERLAAGACDPSTLAGALHALLPSAELVEQARCAVAACPGRYPTLAWLLGVNAPRRTRWGR